MYFLAVFSFGLTGDLAARQSIYPARMFTLPVTDRRAGAAGRCSTAPRRWRCLWLIARLARAVALATRAADRLARLAVARRPGVDAGVHVDAVRIPRPSRDARRDRADHARTLVILAINYKMSEPVLVAFLAPQLPLAYSCACSPSRGLAAATCRIGASSLARVAATSCEAAHAVPIECAPRKCGSSGGATAGRCPCWSRSCCRSSSPCCSSPGYGSTAFVFEMLIACCSLRSVMAGFAAATVSKANPFARDAYGVTPFTATGRSPAPR